MTGRAGGLLLSPVEFGACWAALHLGEPPLLLELRSPGRTMGERDEILRRALAGLRDRGLSDGRRPTEPLASALRLLAQPDYELDIRLGGGRRGLVLGLGAVAGAHGVMVISGDGPLRLVPMDGARVAATLIGLAGELHPGVGRPVNIPADLLDEARAAAHDGNLWTLAEELVRRGVTGQDAGSLARMCDRINYVGQLGATWRPGGRPQRAPWVVGFHRAAAGHFMQLRRPQTDRPGAGETVTVCPTDADRLLRQWRDLVEHLVQAA